MPWRTSWKLMATCWSDGATLCLTAVVCGEVSRLLLPRPRHQGGTVSTGPHSLRTLWLHSSDAASACTGQWRLSWSAPLVWAAPLRQSALPFMPTLTMVHRRSEEADALERVRWHLKPPPPPPPPPPPRPSRALVACWWLLEASLLRCTCALSGKSRRRAEQTPGDG